MIQHIGIIGLLFIILILIVVFIICRCIVQKPIYYGEKIAQRPICYGGANNIVDNTTEIINTIVASPIHVNITASGIPIIDAFREFNTDDLLQTSFIDAFKAYKTYVYDASMIEDFINEIEPLPPPPPPPPKTEEEKLLQFREEFGYAVNITKFVELRDRILSGGTEFKNDGITRKIQKLSYLIDSYTNKHTGIATITNKIKDNYLNDAEYAAHKAQYTLKSLIDKYNSQYNQKINKINNFKDKYYEFSKHYDRFEIFYDIYINIRKGYITNINNLKNYFILKFNIVINLDLIDKIKEKKKEVLKHCCEKLGINSLEVFITVAAITKDNNSQFDNIKALEAIDGNQCWKLLQTLKNKNFTFTDTRPSVMAVPRQDSIKTMFDKFKQYIEHIMYVNKIYMNIDDIINPFDMLELIIVFLYINREYIEINTYINNNIKEPLININIQTIDNNFISTKLDEMNHFSFIYIKYILKYIEKLYKKHPNGRYISGIFTPDPFDINLTPNPDNINLLECATIPNNIPFWNLYDKLNILHRKKFTVIAKRPNIDNYINNTLINIEAKPIANRIQIGQIEYFKIYIYAYYAKQNEEFAESASIKANTEINIIKLEKLKTCTLICIQDIHKIQDLANDIERPLIGKMAPNRTRKMQREMNNISNSLTNSEAYEVDINDKIATLPIHGGGPIANTIHDINAIAYTDITTEINSKSRVLSTPDEQLTSLKRAFNNINKNMDNDFKLLESFFSEFITILRESNPSLIPNYEKPIWVKEEKIAKDFVPPIKDLIVPKKLKESIASIYSMITNESNKVSKTIEILQHIPIIKEKNKVYYNPLTPEEKKMIKKKLLKEDRDELDEEYDIDEIINGMKTNNLVYGRYTLYKDNMWKTIIIPII